MLPKITLSLSALFLLSASAAFATDAAKAAKPAPKADAKTVAKPSAQPTVAKTADAAKSPAADSQNWTGYLIDRSCAAAIQGDNKDAMKSVKEHTKACSLEPSCCEAGYSIYSQGKWLDLDNNSSAMAKKVMQATKRDKAHMVKVVGIIKRGEVRASSIVEVN